MSQHAKRWTRRYRVVVAEFTYEEMAEDVDEQTGVRTRELPGMPGRQLTTRPSMRLLPEPEAA